MEAPGGVRRQTGGQSCFGRSLPPAAISLPSTYQGLVRGLCGNFDGNQKNEFMLPNGSLTQNLSDFGNSWEVEIKGGLPHFSR